MSFDEDTVPDAVPPVHKDFRVTAPEPRYVMRHFGLNRHKRRAAEAEARKAAKVLAAKERRAKARAARKAANSVG